MLDEASAKALVDRLTAALKSGSKPEFTDQQASDIKAYLRSKTGFEGLQEFFEARDANRREREARERGE